MAESFVAIQEVSPVSEIKMKKRVGLNDRFHKRSNVPIVMLVNEIPRRFTRIKIPKNAITISLSPTSFHIIVCYRNRVFDPYSY